MKYIIANWKAHKTQEESVAWIDSFLDLIRQDESVQKKLQIDELRVIVAVPFPFLIPLSEKTSAVKNLELASQDISIFGEGSYTGEVTAEMLRGIISYAVVGHSERRKYFGEDDEVVDKKIKQVLKSGLTPILCVQDSAQHVPQGVFMIAYEPEDAIGTGNNASVEQILSFKQALQLSPETLYLSGGSVDENNIEEYMKTPGIDGCLVGGVSLNPKDFFTLLSKI